MSQIVSAEGLTFDEPDGIAPRGTLVVIPGRGEHPEVYRRFATRLAFDAYRVRVVEPPTVDEGRARSQVTQASTDAVAPLVLVGVDAGALFAVGLAAGEDLEHCDALILAGLPSRTHDTGTAPAWSDELDARTTCPTHRGRISAEIVTPGALYQAIPEEWSDPDAIAALTVPILALHGRDDPISPLDSAREAYGRAARVELVGVDRARHDVLNDQSHRTLAATVVLWLERLRADNDLAPIASTEPLTLDVV